METSRQTKSEANKRFIILMASQSVTVTLVAILLVSSISGPGDREAAARLRDTAAKLQAAGLTSEAIHQYEEYIKTSGIESKVRANISYSLGQMYESEGRPERALAWYYQVEGAAPNSEQQKEAAKRIVALLESLGRTHAAKAVLSGATTLEKDKTQTSGKVVAQIGERKIHLEEIDSAMDALPPGLKPSFEGNEGRKNFLKKYVADELLFEKARRLGYDTDSKWLKQLEEIKRQYLVGRVLNDEVLIKVSVDEKDLKNYFYANKTKYSQNKKTPSFEKVRPVVEQDYRMEKGQAKYQELIEKLVAADNIKLFVENIK